VILVSKTYWAGMPFWFRRTPERAQVESLVLRAHDLRQLRALYWTSAAHPAPRVGVVVIHPRVDFTQHYAIPRLIDAGFGVLAANTRHAGNDTMAEHEEMVLDVGACVHHLLERRRVDKVVLLGNCGGASLCAFYQAQARCAPKDRLARSPAGGPTYFEGASLVPAHGIAYLAPHRGQGKVMLAALDPSVTDEREPLAVDPALDMYDPANGFREPPAWSEYGDEFLGRYRAAQVARVERLDAQAREHLARHTEATAASSAPGFDATSAAGRATLRRRAHEPVMVVYRTMANPAFVDRRIDPSGRDYGSLLSERPDLMNYAALGLARTCTPRAWLSTWSGLSSNADLVANVARIAEPTLLVHAGRDREIYPADIAAITNAMASPDRRVETIADARHYFEPEQPNERTTPHVEAAMNIVVPWIQERFA
jgi:alpha-beta hydrolase superfamily lysophospholipase